MTYCLNPNCQKPQNPDKGKFCLNCGFQLWLSDRYRAIKPMTQGGSGRTFLAIDEGTVNKSGCVIKQILIQNLDIHNPEQAIVKFRKEALQLQILGQHSQIPELFAYFEPDNLFNSNFLPAIVQQLIKGQSLNEVLEKEGVFSEAEIRHLLNQLLPVLQFVHEKGVIHRDVNPANIIRNLEGNIFLVDFSAAKTTSKTALAKTGTLIGSAAYTAPEQLKGQAVFASDLYSLGIICLHLLTQMHPFDLFSSHEGIWVWQDYLIHPVSKQLSQIINKMLADSVYKRYQSAAEILQELNPDKPLIPDSKTSSIFTSPEKNEDEDIDPPRKSLTPTWKCTHTLTGHFSSINALNFSPDGKFLASGSADQKIKIWDIQKNKLQQTLCGHRSLVSDLVFSPNGEILISSSWDHKIKIWHIETGEEINSLEEHSGWIKSLAISSDGKLLASGSADKTIKIWDLTNGQVQITLKGHSGAVNNLAINPQGKVLASGSEDKTIKIWDLHQEKEKAILKGHTDSIESLIFSPGGQILFSGSVDKTIKIWHLGSNSLLKTLYGHSKAVNAVTINSQGNLLIAGGADKTLTIWHPGSGELLYTFFEHLSGVKAVAISPDGLTIASASQDKTIKLWQVGILEKK